MIYKDQNNFNLNQIVNMDDSPLLLSMAQIHHLFNKLKTKINAMWILMPRPDFSGLLFAFIRHSKDVWLWHWSPLPSKQSTKNSYCILFHVVVCSTIVSEVIFKPHNCRMLGIRGTPFLFEFSISIHMELIEDQSSSIFI